MPDLKGAVKILAKCCCQLYGIISKVAVPSSYVERLYTAAPHITQTGARHALYCTVLYSNLWKILLRFCGKLKNIKPCNITTKIEFGFLITATISESPEV